MVADLLRPQVIYRIGKLAVKPADIRLRYGRFREGLDGGRGGE